MHFLPDDFKPESLDSSRSSNVMVGNSNSVEVSVPHVQVIKKICYCTLRLYVTNRLIFFIKYTPNIWRIIQVFFFSHLALPIQHTKAIRDKYKKNVFLSLIMPLANLPWKNSPMLYNWRKPGKESAMIFLLSFLFFFVGLWLFIIFCVLLDLCLLLCTIHPSCATFSLHMWVRTFRFFTCFILKF